MNKRNLEGYSDPTVHAAINNVTDKDKVLKLSKKIFSMCYEAGFTITGKILLKDNRNGKVWGVKTLENDHNM